MSADMPPLQPGMLEGLRVLDLATGSFGYTGKLLAALGADVLKIEPPGGDPLRSWPPFAADEPHPERSLRHLHLSSGKRSLVLDLDREAGQQLLRRLVPAADILLESFEPGHLAARGLGYEALSAARPDLVMVSVTYFGQTGPYADRQGAEIVAGALGGYLKLTGDEDREPAKPYDDLVTQHAALHGAMAAMTGIFHRDATGEGDHFDVSAMEASLYLLGGPVQINYATGQSFLRNGARLLNRQPQLPYPSTMRPCKDGWVHAHHSYSHRDLLAVMMDEPRLEALAEAGARSNADEMDELMDRWLAEHDKFEVVRLAQELRLPFTEVLTPLEVLEDPQLAARDFFVDVDHPVVGTVRQPGPAIRASEAPWQTRRAPLLGEHTDEVLRELLDLDDEAIAALRADGTVA